MAHHESCHISLFSLSRRYHLYSHLVLFKCYLVVVFSGETRHIEQSEKNSLNRYEEGKGSHLAALFYFMVYHYLLHAGCASNV